MAAGMPPNSHQRYRAAGYANINRAFVAFRLNNEYGRVLGCSNTQTSIWRLIPELSPVPNTFQATRKRVGGSASQIGEGQPVRTV